MTSILINIWTIVAAFWLVLGMSAYTTILHGHTYVEYWSAAVVEGTSLSARLLILA